MRLYLHPEIRARIQIFLGILGFFVALSLVPTRNAAWAFPRPITGRLILYACVALPAACLAWTWKLDHAKYHWKYLKETLSPEEYEKRVQEGEALARRLLDAGWVSFSSFERWRGRKVR